MSPFRWDVLAVAFVLAVPLLALGLRGDLSGEEVMARLPWCLAAGYGAVALLRWAAQPHGTADPSPTDPPRDRQTDSEHTPAA